MAPMNELIRLRNVTYFRPPERLLFDNLNWTIRKGESWCIHGPMGSGKSTLAQLLLGQLRPHAGSIEWPMRERLNPKDPTLLPTDVIEYLPFREDSARFNYRRHYYQQRYNFVEPHDDVTLDQFLRCGMRAEESKIRVVAESLGIQESRSRSLIQLSNGQMRRARLARALLKEPELLIIDDPFLGLDTRGRDDLSQMLGQLVQQGQTVVLLSADRVIPSWVSHVLRLPGESALETANTMVDRAPASSRRTQHGEDGEEPVVELHQVRVAYNGAVILQDVSWTVRRGERWALLGPNGAGKTTLLSLLCGDHPQAYSNDVRLFGRRRGTGESIWDIKARVGLVSPEMHLYFMGQLTVWDVVATGWHDILVPRPLTEAQKQSTRSLLTEWNLIDWWDRPFQHLSTGEQRLILLLRACVKTPELLILDEPFQGLDDATWVRCRTWLDDRLLPTQTVLFVTHREKELPASVTRRLVLERGRVRESR